MSKFVNESLVANNILKHTLEVNKEINKMKKGYKEMAAINLAISHMYYDVECEVQSYYDRIAESE